VVCDCATTGADSANEVASKAMVWRFKTFSL
jgi:hypothetical protein